MKELMIVANMAIIFGVIYKLFELLVGRRERMMLIDKLGDKLTPETFKRGIIYRPSMYSFGGLRIGCLLLGVGVGLLAGYCVSYHTQPSYFLSDDCSTAVEKTVSLIYGASVLIGGGLGLVVSYLIELRQIKKD